MAAGPSKLSDFTLPLVGLSSCHTSNTRSPSSSSSGMSAVTCRLRPDTFIRLLPWLLPRKSPAMEACLDSMPILVSPCSMPLPILGKGGALRVVCPDSGVGMQLLVRWYASPSISAAPRGGSFTAELKWRQLHCGPLQSNSVNAASALTRRACLHTSCPRNLGLI